MAAPKPRRRPTATGGAPATFNANSSPKTKRANKNQAINSTDPSFKPNTKQTADNINAAPKRRREPIKVALNDKVYTLRYKTPREWEEFGRLNPHIDPKFWDSPIISKGENFDDSPIHTVKSPYEKLRDRLSRTQNAEPIYGYKNDQKTPTNSREFAKQKTEESLLKRKQIAKLKGELKKEAKEKKRVAADLKQDLNYYERTMYQTGRQSGKVVGVIKREKYRWVCMIAQFFVMGWFFTGQLFLFGLSLLLIGGGMITVGASSLLGMFAAFLGEWASYLSLPFLGGGLGVAIFNSIISLMMVAGVCLLFSFTGIKFLGNSGKRGFWPKFILGLIIIGYSIPIITQWIPWGYIWVKYVRHNPE